MIIITKAQITAYLDSLLTNTEDKDDNEDEDETGSETEVLLIFDYQFKQR